MKQLMLALFMVSTMNGMDLLRQRAEYAATVYLYDVSTDNFFSITGWDINERILGKTILNLISEVKQDRDFIEFLRQRGARTADELPCEPNPGLIRAHRMLSHLVSDVS